MEKFNTSTENKSWKLEGSQLTSEKKEIFEKTSKELSDLKKAILAEPKSKIWSSEVTTRTQEIPTPAPEASEPRPKTVPGERDVTPQVTQEIPTPAPEMTEPRPETVPGERDVAPQVTQEIPTPEPETSTRAPERPTQAPEASEPRPPRVPAEEEVVPQATQEIPTTAPERPEPTI